MQIKLKNKISTRRALKKWKKRIKKRTKRINGKIKKSFETHIKQELNGEPWSKFGVWQ